MIQDPAKIRACWRRGDIDGIVRLIDEADQVHIGNFREVLEVTSRIVDRLAIVLLDQGLPAFMPHIEPQQEFMLAMEIWEQIGRIDSPSLRLLPDVAWHIMRRWPQASGAVEAWYRKHVTPHVDGTFLDAQKRAIVHELAACEMMARQYKGAIAANRMIVNEYRYINAYLVLSGVRAFMNSETVRAQLSKIGISMASDGLNHD